MSEEELITRNTSQITTLRMKYADNEVLYGLPGDQDETMHDDQKELLNNASVRWCPLTPRQIYPRIRWVSLLNPRQVISTVTNNYISSMWWIHAIGNDLAVRVSYMLQYSNQLNFTRPIPNISASFTGNGSSERDTVWAPGSGGGWSVSNQPL